MIVLRTAHELQYPSVLMCLRKTATQTFYLTL